MQGSRFGFIGVIVVLLIAAVAGVIGYNLGVGSGAATTDGATHVVYGPWGWGFGGFGLIFGILFFVLIFSLIRRAVWGGGLRGWYGRGGWGHYGDPGHTHGMPPQAEPMLEDWHRRAHGEAGPGAGARTGTQGAGNPGSSDPGVGTRT
jgi:hypothetical protein